LKNLNGYKAAERSQWSLNWLRCGSELLWTFYDASQSGR